ncbi:MAG: plastocyanin/azurin family copper-binding protein [Bacteroidia bacterium]
MKKLLLFAFPVAFLFSSCGGSQEPVSEGQNQEQPAENQSAEDSTPGESTISIKVIGNSMADMAYEPASAAVKAGDKVTLTLINENSAEGMLHNWILVKLGSGQEVATAAIAAGADKAYVPENENIIAASALANPNETITLEFTAPAVGSYNYICTYPGHFPKMIGKLIVE